MHGQFIQNIIILIMDCFMIKILVIIKTGKFSMMQVNNYMVMHLFYKLSWIFVAISYFLFLY